MVSVQDGSMPSRWNRNFGHSGIAIWCIGVNVVVVWVSVSSGLQPGSSVTGWRLTYVFPVRSSTSMLSGMIVSFVSAAAPNIVTVRDLGATGFYQDFKMLGEFKLIRPKNHG